MPHSGGAILKFPIGGRVVQMGAGDVQSNCSVGVPRISLHGSGEIGNCSAKILTGEPRDPSIQNRNAYVGVYIKRAIQVGDGMVNVTDHQKTVSSLDVSLRV